MQSSLQCLTITQTQICVFINCFNSFHNGGTYNIEICPFLCKKNQETGFYMTRTFIIKGLEPESEKKIEHGLRCKQKTDTYLGLQFNLYSCK